MIRLNISNFSVKRTGLVMRLNSDNNSIWLKKLQRAGTATGEAHLLPGIKYKSYLQSKYKYL